MVVGGWGQGVQEARRWEPAVGRQIFFLLFSGRGEGADGWMGDWVQRTAPAHLPHAQQRLVHPTPPRPAPLLPCHPSDRPAAAPALPLGSLPPAGAPP